MQFERKLYKKKVIIVGCGGHSKVIADIVLRTGDEIKGFFAVDKKENKFMGFPVLGIDSDYENYPDCYFIIGIGDAKIRKRIASMMPNVKWYTAIHPSAVVALIDTVVEEGTVVMANAVINTSAYIGRHCIINTGAVVEHDNIIEDYAHISVGSKLAGNVHVGKCSHIGIGAVVKEGISIGEHCLIGAGAVVIADIKKSGLYVGVPAQLKELKHI